MISFTGKENARLEDSELLRPHQSSRPRHRLRTPRLRGWRVTVLTGACLTGVVLVLNVSLLIWAHQTAVDASSDGVLTLSRGNCPRVRNVMTWSHLAINILSTLLLGASTACMQCVSMPTRKEVDEAHKRGVWLHVGVLGFRNFWHISNWRRAIWVLLALSSVPIHLLYNSIIFSTSSSNDYISFVVTPDFLTGGKWNVSDKNNFGSDIYSVEEPLQIQKIQDKPNSLTRLETSDCVREFSPFSISGWRNVVAITNSSNEANTLLYSTSHRAGFASPPQAKSRTSKSGAIVKYQVTSPPRRMELIGRLRLKRYIRKPDSYERLNVTVDFCLAQKSEPGCAVNLSSPILATVISCNLVKLICLIISVAMRGFKPLITTGDAIESFLTRPDAVTVGYGPASAIEIMRAGSRKLKAGSYSPMARPWKPVQRFWFAAARRRRWAVVLICCFAAWTSALVLLVQCTKQGTKVMEMLSSLSNFQYWWSRGTGMNLMATDVATISRNQSIGSNILLANTPQLLVSLIYILYNGTFTSMLLTAESLRFATKRRTLRVTQPSGSQRNTYWLQLPYRYAIPLMVAISLLHWLISQSLFLIRITIFDSQGRNDPTRSLYGCSWSPLAVFFSTILGGLLIIYLIANGFRRYTDKMPILSSCSLAISAACHRDPLEDEDMAVGPLQYGVLLSAGEGRGDKVGFSGREVGSCVEGVVYT